MIVIGDIRVLTDAARRDPPPPSRAPADRDPALLADPRDDPARRPKLAEFLEPPDASRGVEPDLLDTDAFTVVVLYVPRLTLEVPEGTHASRRLGYVVDTEAV